MQAVRTDIHRKKEIPPAFAVARGRIERLRSALLTWARSSGRSFFWRTEPLSPFDVVVTEILLAKTRAEVAEPVARELLRRFGSPSKLARADIAELEQLLFPLGLHRKRAKHLIACANALVERFRGRVPRGVDDLMQLPYVGRYAANAIACVAFGEPVPVIDANVSRIYQRVFSLPDPPDRLALAHDLWDLGARVLPNDRAKIFNWAILDLGGTVCTAKKPMCSACPLRTMCDDRKRRARNDN